MPTTICAPPGQRAPLLQRVHAADAGRDPRAGRGVEPVELAADLERQLAGRGDDQAERRRVPRARGRLRAAGRHGEAEGDGLARAGLGRDDQVAAFGFGFEHGGLDRGQCIITARVERLREGRGELI